MCNTPCTRGSRLPNRLVRACIHRLQSRPALLLLFSDPTFRSIETGNLISKDSSLSLNKLQTTSPPAVSTSSPIPESPARETAALTAERLPVPSKEPSPLPGQVITADSAPASATTEPSASQPAPDNTQPPSEPSEATELKSSQPNP